VDSVLQKCGLHYFPETVVTGELPPLLRKQSLLSPTAVWQASLGSSGASDYPWEAGLPSSLSLLTLTVSKPPTVGKQLPGLKTSTIWPGPPAPVPQGPLTCQSLAQEGHVRRDDPLAGLPDF
jgi:hypothetical protein